MAQRYKMTLAYDGTRYAGWQVQPGEKTVQGELEFALEELTGESPRVQGSGRTDAGVHARAQVVHFELLGPKDPGRLTLGLNAVLDRDIRVDKVRRASTSFDARRSATGKQYRYLIWNGPIVPPNLRLYRTHVSRPLDLDAMKESAGMLLGTNDFSAFTANPNRHVPSTCRTLRRMEVRGNGKEVTLIAESEGFLYKMVRSLAGFLIRVGRGEVSSVETEEILKSKTRTARVPTAPPEGLWLWNVFYSKRIRLPAVNR